MHFWMEVIGIEYILRILLAGICGMLIGIERSNRSKEAGTRTHFMVACGAALIMVVSKYAFFDLITQGLYEGVEVKLDPSRVASTIASGIGFLGAGMIFVHKNNITGLTTAAGIWATSGVGMAVGAGLYSVGITSTLIIVIAQVLLHLKGGWNKSLKTKVIVIKGIADNNYQEYIVMQLNDIGVKVIDVNVEKVGVLRNYCLTIEYHSGISEDAIVSNINYDCQLKVLS